jgi:SAM-dependent methyltransferase
VRDDAERWNARWQDRTPGEPCPPKGLLDEEVPPVGGRCLDVACGMGEVTVWAAQRGFRVVALDASEVAVDSLRTSVADVGLEDLVDARVHDLDDGLPDDLTGACALVICQRFRDVALYPQLVAALESGGVLVVTVLSRVGILGPAGPFHAPAGDLALGFRDLDVDILRIVEEDGEATLVARRR